jgi:hypothetical protein
MNQKDLAKIAVAFAGLSSSGVCAASSNPMMTYLKCNGGSIVKVDHGHSSVSYSDTVSFFGYSDNFMMMTFSSAPNDPRDLTVRAGLKGQTVRSDAKSITFTLDNLDSINQWQIDKSSYHVTWSLIGKPGNDLEGVSSTIDMNCYRFSQ